jgi:hypothetical protein
MIDGLLWWTTDRLSDFLKICLGFARSVGSVGSALLRCLWISRLGERTFTGVC